MFIKNDNLLIRAATIYDAEILCRWWNNGKIMEHAGYPNGLNTTVEKISNDLLNDNDKHRRLIIELDNSPIGEMSYRTPSDGVAEIGIKICDFTKQENGLGTKYLKMLMSYLFMEIGYNKIILDTNLNNKRAQHVYEKIGFRKVRENIDAFKNQLGELQSSVDYEMTKSEFIDKTMKGISYGNNSI